MIDGLIWSGTGCLATVGVKGLSGIHNCDRYNTLRHFWRSDEGVRLQCEFDIAAGLSAEAIKDIVFSKFYDIAITTK